MHEFDNLSITKLGRQIHTGSPLHCPTCTLNAVWTKLLLQHQVFGTIELSLKQVILNKSYSDTVSFKR